MSRHAAEPAQQPNAGTPPRRLVVCCDGTWNNADQENQAGKNHAYATNVVRLARSILPMSRDGNAQIVYYHTGVGTSGPLDRLVGGAFGVGITRTLREIYAFLANNYIPPGNGYAGDEIFLFGFSRGSYTARSVAGLIGRVGLLHPREMGDFGAAWRWSRLPKDARNEAQLAARFPLRTAPVPIRCIGVWDTIGALGVPRNRFAKNCTICAKAYRFLDAELGTHVEHAFHALAIDEKREPYGPVPWVRPPDAPANQVIAQVWFNGVHSDIGGGYQRHGASDLPFLWMAGQVAPLLQLDLPGIALELDLTCPLTRGPHHISYKGFWHWAGQEPRKPGTGTNEFVHPTALARAAQPNPNFPAFAKLPAWPYNPLENAYLGPAAQPLPDSPAAPPSLPGTLDSWCERRVACIEGS